MRRKQIGWRIDRWTLQEFQKLCAKENLRGSEAVEQFMKLAVENGSVSKALNLMRPDREIEARESKARILLTQSHKGQQCQEELFQLLGLIRDPELIAEIEKELKSRKWVDEVSRALPLQVSKSKNQAKDSTLYIKE